jgi:hypothetical protein
MPTTEWLDAYYVQVDGTAQPGMFVAEDGTTTNAVAAIRIGSTFSGDGVILQGPPEQLVRIAERILDEARLSVISTNKHAQLRALYGRS